MDLSSSIVKVPPLARPIVTTAAAATTTVPVAFAAADTTRLY